MSYPALLMTGDGPTKEVLDLDDARALADIFITHGGICGVDVFGGAVAQRPQEDIGFILLAEPSLVHEFIYQMRDRAADLGDESAEEQRLARFKIISSLLYFGGARVVERVEDYAHRFLGKWTEHLNLYMFSPRWRSQLSDLAYEPWIADLGLLLQLSAEARPCDRSTDM
ncbi:MAG: hypothetical protein AAB582_02890 [Patescibacteria group bacterium]